MQEEFNKMVAKYPHHSTFVCFEMTIKGKNMTRYQITPWFNKLVDKEDYMGCDRVPLVEWLEYYSNGKCIAEEEKTAKPKKKMAINKAKKKRVSKK